VGRVKEGRRDEGLVGGLGLGKYPDDWRFGSLDAGIIFLWEFEARSDA
jgi:hypothetical protein